jgi:hypothetical protein
MSGFHLENWVIGACIVAAPAWVAGCANRASTGAETTGTLRVPLSAVSDGATYRLVDVQIEVFSTSGFGFSGFIQNGASGGDLTETLQTGSYQADLFGWALQREDASGTFQPVVATLTSPDGVPFTIDNGTTSTVTYTFQTDGVTVVVGSGTVTVAVNVNQSDAACTPLGSDCASGSWCPPASLTGADLACVPAGTVALGQPCTDPTSCVANASCFSFGDGGAVCAALCPSSGFNLPCASGGTCQSVTSDYGFCDPDVDGG